MSLFLMSERLSMGSMSSPRKAKWLPAPPNELSRLRLAVAA